MRQQPSTMLLKRSWFTALKATTLFALGTIANPVYAQERVSINMGLSVADNPTVQPSVLFRSGSALARFVHYLVITYHSYYVGTNTPVAYAPMRVAVQGVDSSGGHNHSPGDRPHGWVLTQQEFEASPNFPPDDGDSGAYDDDTHGSITQALTDADGKLIVVYIAPEFSGTEKITGELIFANNPSVSATLDVKVPNLVDLTLSQGVWQFFGGTTPHPSNHWVAADMVKILQNASNLYKIKQEHDPQLIKAINDLSLMAGGIYDFPNNGPNSSPIVPSSTEPLFINDLSLTWGGLFDIGPLRGNFWSPPHRGHRDGRQGDFKSTHLVSGDPLSATANNAVGDIRLESGIAPFNNLPKATRLAMDALVKKIHLRRVTLLSEALRGAGGVFFHEGDHYHAKFAPSSP